MANYYKFQNGLGQTAPYNVSGDLFATSSMTILPSAPSQHEASSWIGTTAAATSGSSTVGEWANSALNPDLNNVEGAPDGTTIGTFGIGLGNGNFLLGSEYGFSIPADGTITGFVVDIIKGTNNTVRMSDEALHLTKDTGSFAANSAGDNKADSGSFWGPNAPLATSSYGTGTTDLWGQTWTPAEVNASTFGICFQASCIQSSMRPIIDAIQITVHYTTHAIHKLEFSKVTQWVQIANGDASETLRYGFSLNGISGSSPATDIGEWGLVPPSTTVGPLPLKLTALYLLADSTTSVTPVDCVAGLTTISTSEIVDNWSGSIGVG